MRTIIAKPGMTLPLGHEGENLAREILFDIDGWRKLYGNGTVQLIASRSGEQDIYPVAITMRDNFAVWPVSRSDTALKGRGCCELQYYSGETLVKSETWTTYVADAMGEPTGDPPEPYQSWVDDVLEAGNAAAESAVRAEEALTKNPKISDRGTWLIWDATQGKYIDTGVSAVGSGVELDTTLTVAGKAADAKAVGEALAEKTEKVRIDFDGTKFTVNGEVINYKQLYDAHIPSADFAFVVYGDRAYLLSYVQDGPGMKEMRFQSVLAVSSADNLAYVKTSGIYVISSDGINIASIRVTDVNSENSAYRVDEITDANKNSDVLYPSVKAVATVAADLKQQIGERYSKPSGGIPESDLSAAVQTKLNQVGGSGGTTDHRQLTNRDAVDQHPMSAITGLSGALAAKANDADLADKYTKPVSGIPESDLSETVQIKLNTSGGLDASGASSGQVPTADGLGSWAWEDVQGGGGLVPQWRVYDYIAADDAVSGYAFVYLGDDEADISEIIATVFVPNNTPAFPLRVGTATDKVFFQYNSAGNANRDTYLKIHSININDSLSWHTMFSIVLADTVLSAGTGVQASSYNAVTNNVGDFFKDVYDRKKLKTIGFGVHVVPGTKIRMLAR